MFTGLVEFTGEVAAIEERGDSARLRLLAPQLAGDVRLGDSIAVNGCCLTVADIDKKDGVLDFDLLAQTLRVTSLGDIQPGSLVNLERALRAGDRLGGHFVQGHVDDTLEVLDWAADGMDHRLRVHLPTVHRGLVIPKGSICLDGISLTAAEVAQDSVTCWIIPHTLGQTHLRQMRVGRRMNVEFDMLGKYVRGFVNPEHRQE